jgi:D-serine deaminase-like pyridoxal phosphate-dependent protein
MQADYLIRHPEDLLSPSLVVFRTVLNRNLDAIQRIAGDVSRLRPHCKTHKMPAVIRMLLDRGITRHKAATIAEVEMLARCGVEDIVLAYNPVGPNIDRVVELRRRFPQVKLTVTADDPQVLGQLAAACRKAGVTVGVLMDVNPGRDRTGLPPGPEAEAFYRTLCKTQGVEPAGFHLYDGHFHQPDAAERKIAVAASFEHVAALRDRLERDGCPVPRIICGGTPTFPAFAAMSDPAIELSPGTCAFHDASYDEKFPDLRVFRPAALLFTRVVSRPKSDRITLDLGTKAVAADPPMGQRAVFPDLLDAVQVLHNEEHLVLETPQAHRYKPGDALLAIPRHVCPCSALHREAYVVEHGELVDTWEITARDRRLTI